MLLNLFFKGNLKKKITQDLNKHLRSHCATGLQQSIVNPYESKIPAAAAGQCCGAGAGTFWSEPEPV